MTGMNRLPVIVRQHIAAFRALLVFTVLCGLIYPALMTGVGQLAFRNQANGSMVSFNGKTVGSSLLCQEFADAKGNPLPQYFQPRPSNAVDATSKTDYGCNPLFSAASNLGPNNPARPRHLPVSTVRALVIKYTQGRTFGFLGEPAVNVLKLNIALDQLSAKSAG